MADIVPILIYHKNCYDGWGAAWVTKKAFPTTQLVPWTYGEPYPEIPDGSFVWMIDVCFPRPVMDDLSQRCFFLRVLDHHKTAQAALDGFPNSVFDMSKSGAMLAWEEFFPADEPPALIKYVQDMDLWTWKLPFASQITTYIRSFPRDIESWDELAIRLHNADTDVDLAGQPTCWPIIEQGAAIMRYDRQRVEEICQQAVMLKLGDYIVPIVNTSVSMSQVAHRLGELYPDAQFTGYYLDRADGKRQFGLRSNRDGNNFDVSEIAKLYGGGGHRNAAGFEASPTFYPVVVTK